MSAEYKNIPPEREFAYLQNAEVAVREATDPVIHKLGGILVQNAEQIVDGEATLLGPAWQADQELAKVEDFPNAVERFTHQNDLQRHFMDSMDQALLDSAGEPNDSEWQPTLKAGYGVNLMELSHLNNDQLQALAELDQPSPPPSNQAS
jgi:hypothetical protein